VMRRNISFRWRCGDQEESLAYQSMHPPLLFPATEEPLEHPISLLHQPTDNSVHPACPVVLLDDRLMLIDDETDGFEEGGEVCNEVEWGGGYTKSKWPKRTRSAGLGKRPGGK
jgi:hypothetical protein